MAIIKSRNAAFILKLTLLLPLSFATLAVAVFATVGGHGNYLPLMLLLGPANILFAVDVGSGGEVFALCLFLCQYEVYALLLKFAKAPATVYGILGLHIASSVIAIIAMASNGTLLLGSTIGRKGVQGILDGLVGFGIVLVLWSLVIWTLVSIRKSNSACADGDSDETKDEDNRIGEKTKTTPCGKFSIGCFIATSAVVAWAVGSGYYYGYGADSLSQVILLAMCIWLSLSGVIASMLGIARKESPKTFCVFGAILNGLAVILVVGCWLGTYTNWF